MQYATGNSKASIGQVLSQDSRLAIIWLVIRLYVGWEWLHAGYEKVINPNWVGAHAGVAVQGFLRGALQKTTGAHPDVQSWYAWFIQHIALPHATTFSYLVSFGELFVGAALILGILTGTAAFFGAFMNFNYLFAGTVSLNPVLLLLEIFLILAWRTAGLFGLDRWILPRVSK